MAAEAGGRAARSDAINLSTQSRGARYALTTADVQLTAVTLETDRGHIYCSIQLPLAVIDSVTRNTAAAPDHYEQIIIVIVVVADTCQPPFVKVCCCCSSTHRSFAWCSSLTALWHSTFNRAVQRRVEQPAHSSRQYSACDAAAPGVHASTFTGMPVSSTPFAHPLFVHTLTTVPRALGR